MFDFRKILNFSDMWGHLVAEIVNYEHCCKILVD